MNADQLIKKISTEILNPVIGLMMVIAFAVFLWGIVEFIANADNEQKREDGKRHIIWGLVGLLIMVAVGGIIAVINNFIGSIK